MITSEDECYLTGKTVLLTNQNLATLSVMLFVRVILREVSKQQCMVTNHPNPLIHAFNKGKNGFSLNPNYCKIS